MQTKNNLENSVQNIFDWNFVLIEQENSLVNQVIHVLRPQLVMLYDVFNQILFSSI